MKRSQCGNGDCWEKNTNIVQKPEIMSELDGVQKDLGILEVRAQLGKPESNFEKIRIRHGFVNLVGKQQR